MRNSNCESRDRSSNCEHQNPVRTQNDETSPPTANFLISILENLKGGLVCGFWVRIGFWCSQLEDLSRDSQSELCGSRDKPSRNATKNLGIGPDFQFGPSCRSWSLLLCPAGHCCRLGCYSCFGCYCQYWEGSHCCCYCWCPLLVFCQGETGRMHLQLASRRKKSPVIIVLVRRAGQQMLHSSQRVARRGHSSWDQHCCCRQCPHLVGSGPHCRLVGDRCSSCSSYCYHHGCCNCSWVGYRFCCCLCWHAPRCLCPPGCSWCFVQEFIVTARFAA